MSKQDRQGVRSASDLERKYEFGAIKEMKKREGSADVEKIKETLSQFEVETKGNIEKINQEMTDIKETYAKKIDLTGIYKYKGSVTDETELPTEEQENGDVYNIVNESIYGAPGMNVAWNGENWDPLGGVFKIEYLTDGEIDAICV